MPFPLIVTLDRGSSYAIRFKLSHASGMFLQKTSFPFDQGINHKNNTIGNYIIQRKNLFCL